MLNDVNLIGRTGKEPEVKTLENGTKLAKISLATTEKYKDRDGNKQENTEWHNLVLWKQKAEVAEKYLQKGQLIFVNGKLKTRKYEKDGQTRYMTEVHVNEFKFLQKAEQRPEPADYERAASQNDDDDDLPF